MEFAGGLPGPLYLLTALGSPDSGGASLLCVRGQTHAAGCREAVGVTRTAFLEFNAICSQEGDNSSSMGIEFLTALGNNDLQVW